jgi:hypothetical protein
MKVSHLGVVTLPEPLPLHGSLSALQQDATNVYWTPDYEHECEALLKCIGLPLWTALQMDPQKALATKSIAMMPNGPQKVVTMTTF